MKKSKAVNKQKQSSKQTAKKKHVTKGTAAARKSQSTTNTKKNIKAVKKVSQAYMDVKSKKWKKGSSNIATDSYNEVPSDLSSQVTTSASEESLTSESDENKVVFRHAYEDPNWEGNEDDRGSVASGILEEDFCQICGLSTLAAGSWSNVILCDVCDSEYHIPCLKMNKVPRSMFVCYKCNKETDAMKNLRFVSDVFRIPRRKIINRAVIYTPSRPLESAFHECVEKGLMVVSEIFPYDVMRALTHGNVQNTTKSGRIADVWQGATVEIPKRLSSCALTDMIDRDGRFDLKLPEFVVDSLCLNELLAPTLAKLRSIMGNEPQLRTHNVVFAPVGSKSQQWHTDDHAMKQRKPYRYFTILIHLNSLDAKCGGTEVWSYMLDRGDLIRTRPGDALVFSGSLLHRGLGNQGNTHRFFYYASFACGIDMNVAML